MSPLVSVPIIACVTALLLTPMTSRLAHAKGWVDVPGGRKIHRQPVAYLGGAAVMAALLVGLSCLLWLPSASAAYSASFDKRLAAIVAGCGLMFVVGLVDDVKDIRATKKLLAQLLAAVGVCASGVVIDGLPITDSLRLEFGVFGPLITVFWIVGVTNAMNIIDGLDGLASGISTVACAAISWTAFENGNPAAGMLMLALMGAILGFLPYNLHPAKVFLGDAGSLTIGFALASASALTATKAPTAVGLCVPLVALGIPILDTLFAMVRRAIERRSMLSADKSHLHHRLMALGYGQPKTVLLLCTVAALGVLATTAATPTNNLQRVLLAAAALAAYTSIFRMTGAIRFRESLAAMGEFASSAKAAADERQLVDEAAIGLGAAEDLDQWWSALTHTGERLSFREMELELAPVYGGHRELRWVASHTTGDLPETDDVSNGEEQLVSFTIPVPAQQGEPGGGTLRVMADASASVEQVARRMRVFCRVIEKNRPTINRGDAGLSVSGTPDVAVSS